MPLPVVIDSDPGIDDSLALLLALASPELDVRGISVSYGNTVVENAMRNAVEVVRRAGKRIPLAMGARRPLKRALAVALETHGASGLGDAKVPPAGTVIDFMKPLERLLAEQPEPITLVTLGPVTSLAVALKRAPDVVREKVSRHIGMIGNLDARGNTTPYSEFNAWCDPEALAQVLSAELPTDLVTLDVTREIVLTGKDIGALAEVGEPQAQWLSGALSFYHRFHQQYEGLDGCVVNDVLVIAALIDSSVLTFQPSRLTVGLEDGDERGRTQVDMDGWKARVATTVNASAVRSLLFERVLPWLNEPATAGRGKHP
ncbi:MAG TPA: nucleoside hydrolase [Gemmatimonadales bacterium]|nr:nucleoside hydrolase [Gemmatimonadales bacterium]